VAGVARSARGSGEAVPRDLGANVLAWIRHAHLRQEGRPGLAATCRVEWPDRWL